MGMRPVVEMQFIDFIANAYDMLTNYVATARYRAFLPCPMVVRGPSGGYVRGGPFHSQNPEAGFVHTPGLKVVYPATAEDAKGLMKAAIRDDDCVLFFEHKYLYRRIKAEMPAGDHVVPIGKARVAREGKDLSIITYAATVWKALEAAEQLREGGRAVGRGDRPALAGAAGRRGDSGDGAEDESRADRARGHAHRRHRGRDHGADQRDVVRVARRAGAAGDGARRSAAVRAVARGLRAAADGGHRARGADARGVLSVADGERDSADGGADGRTGRQYLGVGCFTAFAGFAGGGMIAVLVAKIVGGVTRCAAGRGDGRAVQLVHVLVYGAIDRRRCCFRRWRSGCCGAAAPARQQLGTRVMRWHA